MVQMQRLYGGQFQMMGQLRSGCFMIDLRLCYTTLRRMLNEQAAIKRSQNLNRMVIWSNGARLNGFSGNVTFVIAAESGQNFYCTKIGHVTRKTT